MNSTKNLVPLICLLWSGTTGWFDVSFPDVFAYFFCICPGVVIENLVLSFLIYFKEKSFLILLNKYNLKRQSSHYIYKISSSESSPLCNTEVKFLAANLKCLLIVTRKFAWCCSFSQIDQPPIIGILRIISFPSYYYRV